MYETKRFSMNKTYLFSWDRIPGNDDWKLIEFLDQNFDIDWVKAAKIEKIDNGKTVKIYTENNSLLLRLNDENTKVNLTIDDGRTDEFIVKLENGKLNIYNKMKKIISILSGKGGTGKTSIITNLGVHLAQQGQKVLLVDMDFFTRGLTFYITKGKISFQGSVINILKGDGDKKPTEIRENLFLLPPSEQSLDIGPSSEIDELFQRKKERFCEALMLLKNKFDLILIDHRSGIDSLTLSSALFSDGYVIVTEEDKTSQRASRLLIEAIDKQKHYECDFALPMKNKSGMFLGFIVNMYTTNFGDDLIGFLETSVFGNRCLAAIPHFATVRKVFVRDEIMIEKLPNHDFSLEIQALSKALLDSETSTPRKRANRRRRRKLLEPIVPATIVTYAYIAIFTVFRKTDMLNPYDLILPILPFLILIVWLYLKRD